MKIEDVPLVNDITHKEEKDDETTVIAEAQPTIYKFCPSCGFNNEKSFKFCPGCGNSLLSD